MTLPPFKAIAAMSLNRVIGKGNTLPWNIPEELEWFKKNTLDQIIIMGRKTYDSIGRPLPRRQSIILSKTTPNNIPGVTVIHDLHDLLSLDLPPEKTLWIIGGAQIYTLTLPYTSELYLTIVKKEIPDGDAFFPPFENSFTPIQTLQDNPLYTIIQYKNLNLKTFK